MYLRTHQRPGLGYASYHSYFGGPTQPPATDCPGYESGEVELSHCQTGPCQQGHLAVDVARHPRGLLIADFGVAWSGIKAATKKEKLLQDWIAEVKANLYSTILRIYGYSDCIGAEKNNTPLRRSRAEHVYGLLDADLRSRVDFLGAAKPGEYITDNKTKQGRATNRGVIIEVFQLREEIIDITDTRCITADCPPPPPPPTRCVPPNCPPPPPKCVPPNCPPPDKPQPPTITDPPPRIPKPDLPPKDILDWLREVINYLKRNGGDPGLIKKLEGLLFEAIKIATFAGAVFGLFMFVNGELIQVTITTDLILQRILSRFESSGMKKALEKILREITDPKTRDAIDKEIKRTQGRDPDTGKFKERQPGDEPPGSQHERNVCDLVKQRYRYFSDQVRIKRYAKAIGMPGQPPPKDPVPSDPVSKVDCIGSRWKDRGYVLYEAKDSGPADFTNPGLTPAQRIVYPALVNWGGLIHARGGPFPIGSKFPVGTRVRIITPANMNDI